MQTIFILLYVYSLTLLASGADTHCRYHNLQAFPAPHHYVPINVAEFQGNCLKFPSFNATIDHGTLIVHGCANAKYNLEYEQEWQSYTAPVTLKKGQFAHVKCDEDSPVLLVNPPSLEEPGKGLLSDKPSVFVVMIDAVSYEALHRFMPKTVAMLKNEQEVDIHDFNKYSTLGVNSNPNKFALFGRHDFYNILKSESRNANLSWIWEHAKEQGYTTVIAEDECPRHDSVWDLMNVPTHGNKLDSQIGPDFVLFHQLCVPDPHPNKYCVKGRWGYEYLVDYVTSMLANFEENKSDKPIFMWSNFIDAHEPTQWAAALMDTTVANYLRAIMHSRFMDNGVIVFLSDHGLHFGDFAYSSILGSAENKHPFLYVMSKKGTLKQDIVSANEDKLITPNDLYRTFSSLIGHTGVQDPRDIDIISQRVPADRTCDMAGIPAPFCMCSYGPETCSLDLPASLWHTCVSKYAHPRFFDWKHYSAKELAPRFKRDFTECESVKHWCAYGLSLGWNGTDHSNLRAYVARTPVLESPEFCWNWPSDCNWGYIMEYYFNQGYVNDKSSAGS